MSNDKKLDLKLNDDNELSFKLSIEGTVSDPELASPRYRFTITELGEEEKGWIFPARKEADDIVTVSIPAPLKSGFKAKRVYKGTLEVILGRLYFSPAELQLEFSTPLEIQAEIASASGVKAQESKPLLSEESPSAEPSALREENDMYDEEEILSVISEEKKAAPPPRKTAPPRIVQQPSAVKKPVPAQRAPVPGAAVAKKAPAPSATKPTAKKPLKETDEKKLFKAKLLNMFKSALSD